MGLMRKQEVPPPAPKVREPPGLSPFHLSSPPPQPDAPETQDMESQLWAFAYAVPLAWAAILPSPGSLLPIPLDSSGAAPSGCPFPACASPRAVLISHPGLARSPAGRPAPPYPQVPTLSLAQARQGAGVKVCSVIPAGPQSTPP